MSDFTAACAADVLATATAAKGEAAEAIGRALGLTVQLEVEQGVPLTSAGEPASEFAGPALVLTLGIGSQGALLVLPAVGDWLPSWIREPDATGKSKLNSLAQELGMILIPEKFPAETFQASWVADGWGSIQQSNVASESARLNLVLTSDSKTYRGAMIWPASKLEAALKPATAPPGTESAALPSSNPVQAKASAPTSSPAPSPATAAKGSEPPPQVSGRNSPQYRTLEEGLRHLPPYTQSLLRIKVPVVVSLAETKQTVENILKIGPGSILQFKKACDEALTLEIGRSKLAHGEAVKVGEKFGLWITSMILPEERFGPAQIMESKRPVSDIAPKT